MTVAVHVSSPFLIFAALGLLVASASCVWWRSAQQRGLAPSRRPLCRRAVGFDRGADGDPRPRHQGRRISRRPCRLLEQLRARARQERSRRRLCRHHLRSHRGQHAAARLDRADAERLGAARRTRCRPRSFAIGPGAAGARPDRLGAAAGRHRPAAARARRRASWRRSGRPCRSWRSAGRPVTVRFIIGQYPPDNVDVPAFYKALTDGFDLGRLTVSVAAFRSCVAVDDCDSYSWNHSKIIAIDGAEALVGGHNLWAQDYLMDEPVSDLSMRVKGPAAASAVRFIDRLWEYRLHQSRPEGLDRRSRARRAAALRRPRCRSGDRAGAACRSSASAGWAPASPRTSPTRASSRAT